MSKIKRELQFAIIVNNLDEHNTITTHPIASKKKLINSKPIFATQDQRWLDLYQQGVDYLFSTWELLPKQDYHAWVQNMYGAISSKP